MDIYIPIIPMIMSTKRRYQPLRLQQRLHKRLILSLILEPTTVPLLTDSLIVYPRRDPRIDAVDLIREDSVGGDMEEGK